MPVWRTWPSQRDSNQTASRKPGAVHKRATNRVITRFVKVENASRRNAGYTYFISGDAPSGYHFALVNRYGNEVFTSVVFLNKDACRAALRTAQRHGACTDIRDDTR